MNPDDFDGDGNNIVPCPICLDNYCPSKQGGKCVEDGGGYSMYEICGEIIGNVHENPDLLPDNTKEV